MAQEVLQIEDGLPAEEPRDATPSGASLEAALAELDQRLAVATRALSTARKYLKQAVEASRQGKLRDLPRALASAVESSESFAQTALNAQHSWEFDVQAHLESGRYMSEVLGQAEAGGLTGAREVDGQLNSFPVTVKVDARDPSLKIGKKRHRAMRPSVLVEALRQMRGQPVKETMLRQLLSSFEKTYLFVTRGEDGIAVPLKSIYDAQVLRPGESREYTLPDFLLDVYRVDRSGLHVTPAGRELSLPASTGAKGGRVLQFLTETGEERIYSSMRFDPAP
jgi:hypothetical protein